MAPVVHLALALIAWFTREAECLPSYSDYTAFEQVELAPNTSLIWVAGGGSTAAGPYFSATVPLAMMLDSQVYVSYAETGSSRGSCRLLDFLSRCANPWANTGNDTQTPTNLDFAVVTQDLSSAVHAQYPDLALYPAQASAIAVVHDVENLTAPLVLSRVLLAQVFRQCNYSAPGSYCSAPDIRYWNDSAILALNPGQDDALNAAGAIRLVVRGDSVGVTGAFKRALAKFDSAFASQIDLTAIDPESATWRAVNVYEVYGLYACAGTLLPSSEQPPGSADISYVPLQYAQDMGLQLVGITSTTSRDDAVFPNADSVNKAVLERSMDYDASAQSRIVDLTGANNQGAWPIVLAAFFAVRLDTMRPGATCRTRLELLRYAETLLGADTADQLSAVAATTGSVLLPPASRADNLAGLQGSLMCNGTNVHEPAVPTMLLVVAVPEGLNTVMSILVTAFSTAEATSPGLIDRSKPQSKDFQVQVTNLAAAGYQSFDSAMAAVNGTGALLVSTSLAAPYPDTVVAFPFAGVAVVARVNWCGSDPVVLLTCAFPTGVNLNLTVDVIVKIFQGSITLWNDSQIEALNPSVELPAAPIVTVAPPVGFWRDVITARLRAEDASFAFINAGAIQDLNLQQGMAVLYHTRYAIMLAPATTDVALTADAQTIVADLGFIAPTDASIVQCARAVGAYNPAWRNYSLQHTSACYPLVIELDLVGKREQGSACVAVTPASEQTFEGFLPPLVVQEDSTAVRTMDLLRWLLDSPLSYASMQQASEGARADVAKASSQQSGTMLQQTMLSVHLAPLFDVENVVDAATASLWATRTAMASGFAAFTCDGAALATSQEELNLVSDGLVYGMGYTVCFGTILLCVVLAVWVYAQRQRKVIKYASPTFLWTVLAGAALTSCTIIPLSVQDQGFNRDFGYSDAELQALDYACGSVPWMFCIGLLAQLGALMIKTWRLVKIFDNPLMRVHRNLHDSNLALRGLPVMFVLCVFLAVWTAVDRPFWDRVPLVVSTDIIVQSSVGLCTVKQNPWIWIGPLLMFIVGLMLAGLALCYKARALPSEFQESGWITLALLLQFESLMLAVPILSLTASNTTASYVFKVAIILMASTGTVLIIFVPKLWFVLTLQDSKSASASKGPPSKEEKRVIDAMVTRNSSFRVNHSLKREERPLSMMSFRSAASSRMVLDLATSSGTGSRNGGAKPPIDTPNPSVAELEAVTQGTLSTNADAFFHIMEDPELRDQLRRRLSRSFRSEGLDFVVAVVERNRAVGTHSCVQATKRVVREFLVPSAPYQINLSAQASNAIFEACFAEDEASMCAADLFRAPVLEACREIVYSHDFSQFMNEHL